jgi:aerobic-type carbon monoxide dehydrogenase small subunit (CoxS/CutS family)
MTTNTSRISWHLNGRPATYQGDAAQPVLWHLRDELGLTGTKYGCGIGVCGACTVLVDGQPSRACVVPMSALSGRQVTTIEGLARTDGQLHPVQQAWVEANVPQCGYCQAGQIMATMALLQRVPRPQPADVDQALRANLCRCGTYARIRPAVARAAELMRATSTERK